MNLLFSSDQSDEYFMSEALKQARMAAEKDEVPVGAIIVFEKKIIARAHNQVELLQDPTAHAEMIAITQATNAIKSKWLLNCTLYVTLEPCSMCAGAMVLARLKQLIFGAKDPKTGACGSIGNIANHPALNHKINVRGGVEADLAGALISDFFQKKRSQSRENNS